MKDFRLGIVHVNNEHAPVVEKVGNSVCVLTNLGPYTDDKTPVRLNQVINLRTGEIVQRSLERYYANYGDIGDDSAPYWSTIHNPRKNDLEDACKTLGYAYNGAYGKIDEEMAVFLTSIRDQTIGW
jgi:hypothetical protein